MTKFRSESIRIAVAVLAAILLALATFAPALAEPPYRDDRTTATSLVQSLYNAINRREYARAFDYFVTPPAKSFAAYANGFTDTRSVELLVGVVAEEGAAGSTYYSVPVALKAISTGGSESYFGGCYVVRQSNVQAQEPPFRALRIESGKLKPSTAVSLESVDLDCDSGGPVEEAAAGEAEATGLYLAAFEKTCPFAAQVRAGTLVPETHEITYRQDSFSTGDSTARLFRFPCQQAAYNESQVYLLQPGDGFSPLRIVSLAEPELKLEFEDAEQAELKSMAIEGFSTQSEAVNSFFDEKSKSISTFSKWRGVGDASSSGLHAFKGGQFVLWDYAVDPTLNAEIDPLQLIKAGKVLAVPVPVAE